MLAHHGLSDARAEFHSAILLGKRTSPSIAATCRRRAWPLFHRCRRARAQLLSIRSGMPDRLFDIRRNHLTDLLHYGQHSLFSVLFDQGAALSELHEQYRYCSSCCKPRGVSACRRSRYEARLSSPDFSSVTERFLTNRRSPALLSAMRT